MEEIIPIIHGILKDIHMNPFHIVFSYFFVFLIKASVGPEYNNSTIGGHMPTQECYTGALWSTHRLLSDVLFHFIKYLKAQPRKKKGGEETKKEWRRDIEAI